MSLGNRLLNLRKKSNLSQEEVAEKLNVSRQTISKWETDGSTPDFDKILPLCNLYGITPDELLMETKDKKEESSPYEVEDENEKRIKRAKGISLGVLLYFVAVVWIMISIPVFMMNPVVASAIFLFICGLATYSIVYVCIVYKKSNTKVIESDKDKLRKSISSIVAIFTVIIYLSISFTTFAWHITWIIWIVYGLFDEILKLIFMLRGNDNEE